MSPKDDQPRPRLPVTAEVGGEGGSFADPTNQVATFEGEVANAEEPGASAGDTSDVVDSDTAAGARKFPTEP